MARSARVWAWGLGFEIHGPCRLPTRSRESSVYLDPESPTLFKRLLEGNDDSTEPSKFLTKGRFFRV